MRKPKDLESPGFSRGGAIKPLSPEEIYGTPLSEDELPYIHMNHTLPKQGGEKPNKDAMQFIGASTDAPMAFQCEYPHRWTTF